MINPSEGVVVTIDTPLVRQQTANLLRSIADALEDPNTHRVSGGLMVNCDDGQLKLTSDLCLTHPSRFPAKFP